MKSTKNNNWKRVHMCGHDPARPDHTYTKAEISYRKNTLEEFKRLGTGIYTMLFCTLGMFIIGMQEEPLDAHRRLMAFKTTYTSQSQKLLRLASWEGLEPTQPWEHDYY